MAGVKRRDSMAAPHTNGFMALPGCRRACVARLNCDAWKSSPPTSARTPRVAGSMATSAPCTSGVCSSASGSGLPAAAVRAAGTFPGTTRTFTTSPGCTTVDIFFGAAVAEVGFHLRAQAACASVTSPRALPRSTTAARSSTSRTRPA
ncbi:hypothetical protein PSR1_04011 [Anaeromyxobacter sp. PSR-1]|nr:hypothetical protein PSR1_04011 [Anaeromyxobacter sp. PSR-1]